jgi:hypothetical protein
LQDTFEQETEPLSSDKIVKQFKKVVPNLKIHENKIKKMPIPPPKQRTEHGTYLYFAEPGTLESFMRDYRRILMDNFQRVRIEGGGEYWSCGQGHDPRNWYGKPW